MFFSASSKYIFYFFQKHNIFNTIYIHRNILYIICTWTLYIAAHILYISLFYNKRINISRLNLLFIIYIIIDKIIDIISVYIIFTYVEHIELIEIIS